jgi:hypothetical protein
MTMTTLRIVTVATLTLLCGCTTFAAETSDAVAVAPSKQAREQMAQLHEKMAACLRSDRALTDCRSEMMRDCRAVKDGKSQHGCSMGMMGRDRENQGTTDESKHTDHKH